MPIRVCLCLCMYMYLQVLPKVRRGFDLLQMESQVVVSSPIWMLGIEIASSEGAVSVLNLCFFSLQLHPASFLFISFPLSLLPIPSFLPSLPPSLSSLLSHFGAQAGLELVAFLPPSFECYD